MPVVSFAPSQDFLNEVRTDIAALPQGAVEIAAALVSMQFALPVALVDWLIAEMGQHADLTSVSPVALASMKISGVANYIHKGMDTGDIAPEYALLCALEKEQHLAVAIEFLARLVQGLASLAQANCSIDPMQYTYCKVF
jgi:hypothetical protein